MEPMGYQKEYAASPTVCAPTEVEVRANAHLNQESITRDRRNAPLNNFQSRKKGPMESLQIEQRQQLEMAWEKEASSCLIAPSIKR